MRLRRFFPLLIFVIFAILFAYFFIPDETIEITNTTATTSQTTSETTTKINVETNSEYNIYKINISADCISNNSVGNDWIKVYSINDQTIKNGDKISVPQKNPEVKFSIYIEEDDSFPDIETKEIILNLDSKKVTTTSVIVTENRGKFTGNTAEWKFEINVEHII